MNQCKLCKKYKGDCGYHFKDKYGHIDYDCPAESYCDRYGWCSYYETTDRLKNGGFNLVDEITIYNTLTGDRDMPSITLHQFKSWEHIYNEDGSYDIILHGGVVIDE